MDVVFTYPFLCGFDLCLESLSCWKICLRPRLSFLPEATRFSAKISSFFYLIVPLILNTTPGPLAAKHEWPIAIFDSQYEAILLCIPCQPGFPFCCQTCWWDWSHPTIDGLVSSSHNSNEVWQTQDIWFCLVCLVRTVCVPPFQRVCWDGAATFFLDLVTQRHNQQLCNSWPLNPPIMFRIYDCFYVWVKLSPTV